MIDARSALTAVKVAERGSTRRSQGDAKTGDKSDFFGRLQRVSLSPRQRVIAHYLADNYRNAASHTASELGLITKTSEATVIRLAKDLGYAGFPGLRRQLHNMLREDLTSLQLLARERELHTKHLDTLTNVVQTEAGHLRALASSISRDNFNHFVTALLKARRVYIAGHRAATSLAHFFGYNLAKVHKDVVILTDQGTASYDVFRTVPAKSWLIAIAFRRYPRETVELLDFVRSERISVAAITDSPFSPIAKRADITISLEAAPISFVDSYCAQQALITAILVEYARRGRRRTEAILKRFEGIASSRNFFIADD
jgi:DNA-binding MurR/RpiR family transcriptional regulator